MSCRPIFPDLKITNGPPKPLYPTSKRNLVPILKSDTSKNKENKKKTITSNWEISNREPKSPNSQNLNNFAFDDDLLRINRSPGNSSPKFASSHHGLCTNPVRNFWYSNDLCVCKSFVYWSSTNFGTQYWPSGRLVQRKFRHI